MYIQIYIPRKELFEQINNEQLIEKKLNENYYHSGLLIGYFVMLGTYTFIIIR